MALLLIGGVYVYRNRSVISRFFDQFGVQLPEWFNRKPSELLSKVREGMDRGKQAVQG